MEQNLPPPTLIEPNPDHYLNREREIIRELKERIETMSSLYRKAENYDLTKRIKELEDENLK